MSTADEMGLGKVRVFFSHLNFGVIEQYLEDRAIHFSACLPGRTSRYLGPLLSRVASIYTPQLAAGDHAFRAEAESSPILG